MDGSVIKPQKIAEQVAVVLEERIVSGVYPVGSKLPPERQLAVQLGVSRPSVRDALQVLATRQMIESHHGDGHYVSDRLQQDFLSGWQSLLGRHEYLEGDVLDFRRSLEGTLAALAAERHTETDLVRMQFWLDELQAAYAAKDLNKQSQADVGFHQAIAEAAHNVLFGQLSGSLLRMLHQHTQKNLANMFYVSDLKLELRHQHQAIFDAIRKRQPQKAHKMAQQHIDYVRDTLVKSREVQQREARAHALAGNDAQRSGQ